MKNHYTFASKSISFLFSFAFFVLYFKDLKLEDMVPFSVTVLLSTFVLNQIIQGLSNSEFYFQLASKALKSAKLDHSFVGLLIIAFGLPFLTVALANGIVDTIFFGIKILANSYWLKAILRSPEAPYSIFDIFQALVATIILIYILTLLFEKKDGKLSSFFKFGSFHWSFPICVLLSPIILAIPNIVSRYLFKIETTYDMNLSSQGILSAIVILGLITPIQEELTWRGYFLSTLEKCGFGYRTILLSSSIAFALIHLPSDIGILRPIALLPTAVILTWMRLRSGGIIWSLLFHSFGNVIVTITPLNGLIFSYLN